MLSFSDYVVGMLFLLLTPLVRAWLSLVPQCDGCLSRSKERGTPGGEGRGGGGGVRCCCSLEMK